MKKILIIFGTRPEAIKMAPLYQAFKNSEFETRVCITAQHREMLDQVLQFFSIQPEYDLNLMVPNQNLYSLTANIIESLKPVMEDFQPDYVFVHGDTTTTLAASIAGFYSNAKVCHVEAGLRTHNIYTPFPEEMNRQVTSRLAEYHFAPTSESEKNLLSENIAKDKILVTGNTVIDALLYSADKVEAIENDEINDLKKVIDNTKKLILITGHRRENHGDGFVRICNAIKEIALQNDDVQIVYPVHLNPNVQDPVNKILSGISNIVLINPLSYPSFVWLMKKSYIIITDSGGVQEEAPSLGKPVLVMRETTERPEAVKQGTVILVGTNKDKIIKECNKLLKDQDLYKKMSEIHNPYGDGNASKRIVDFIAAKPK
ncbi:non-hydrolyzing UDP-N-acetylglucosamine 2-epimerase [Chryseobacterium sp. T20]|uniref:non-hydrolyzing UDP-N-acetylglucosamine 2-epimerase n=1 Tax=Chryseobacterium sp. T20 TaxID=3395375 RepID=UPI0039BC315C